MNQTEEIEYLKKKIEMLTFCLDGWQNKTEWVQELMNSGELHGKYLGMHRADVILALYEQLKEA